MVEKFSRKPLLPSIGPPLKPGLALDGSGHRLVQLGRGHCGAGRAARQGVRAFEPKSGISSLGTLW